MSRKATRIPLELATLVITVVVAFALTVVPSAHAAPANDNLASAQTITGSDGQTSGSNVDATLEPGEPSGNIGSVWYSWTAPYTGVWSIDTRLSTFDTVLAVYSGTSIDTLHELARNDDGDAGYSFIEMPVVSGQTYLISVSGFDALEQGAISLEWARTHPSVSGLVTDQNGAELSNVRVMLFAKGDSGWTAYAPATTDGSYPGWYSFVDVPAGEYRLRFGRDWGTGYQITYEYFSDKLSIGDADSVFVVPGTDVVANEVLRPPVVLTLLYVAGNGGSIGGPVAQSVLYGTDAAPVTAVAAAGYHFVQWSDGLPTASRTDTNVKASMTVSAVFAADTVVPPVVPPVVATPEVTPVVVTPVAPTVTKPKVTLTTPVAPLVMYRARYKTVYGYLKPRHAAGSTSVVRIYRYKKNSKGVYVKYDYVRAKLSNYSTYSKYTKSLAFPSRGKWRIRAYAPADTKHAATWSSKYDYVTVK